MPRPRTDALGRPTRQDRVDAATGHAPLSDGTFHAVGYRGVLAGVDDAARRDDPPQPVTESRTATAVAFGAVRSVPAPPRVAVSLTWVARRIGRAAQVTAVDIPRAV